MLCYAKYSLSCFLKENLEALLWSDDILAHDFREPQSGQYISCQENTHKVYGKCHSAPQTPFSDCLD